MRWPALLLVLVCFGCETFDPPPAVTLVGAEEGSLPAGEPVVLSFSEPPVADSLRVSIASYVVDAEGNLGDEDNDPGSELDVRFAHVPGDSETGGTSVLGADGLTLTITPDPPLPVGPALVVLVEPGLADAEGNVTGSRQRLKFAHVFDCGSGDDKDAAPIGMPSGPYFMLVEVDEPVPTQVQLWAWLEVDGETGLVLGQFSNGDRNPDPDRCPSPCDSSEACQLIPSPKCVAPSTKAGGVDEYPDWIANTEPPTGYTFTIHGCARGQPDGSTAFATEPADTETQSPPVKSEGITMSGVLAEDLDGVLRGSGSFKVEQVYLGDTPSGPGLGSLRMRLVPEAEAPPMPRP